MAAFCPAIPPSPHSCFAPGFPFYQVWKPGQYVLRQQASPKIRNTSRTLAHDKLKEIKNIAILTENPVSFSYK
ncbi:hypothetical protein OC25_24540 [Pedobacter kyungheensis]|uniref:Uncharacterized protein n=1 Tax=Pedobacter kyungheensis TaxID=1069985 RepID=A0A0C1D0S2_9SPHI|nr:hypothetical protein OC25_24540 [Pedobacter kyungheensis]